MSKIKNSGLDQYGTEAFEQQRLEQLALKGLNNLSQSHIPIVRHRPTLCSDVNFDMGGQSTCWLI